ncbi:hypothetical protein [Croceicoccus pelagius]|uniref:Uncharacterized protein n=1 Tax=Croceicoccus pelagius TaxID=1703341 RepID=A0A916Y402_9SPHN|nr:hypothetical protein [Croceicoccus pelagius]GGD30375.1 hypothetical protein GCM10010989_00550 [Croceicoccus pelagius]
MERHGDEVDVSTTEARAGSTPHIVRYVLIISLVLAAAAMTIVWITGAATADDPVESGSERTSDPYNAAGEPVDGAASEVDETTQPMTEAAE